MNTSRGFVRFEDLFHSTWWINSDTAGCIISVYKISLSF